MQAAGIWRRVAPGDKALQIREPGPVGQGMAQHPAQAHLVDLTGRDEIADPAHP